MITSVYFIARVVVLTFVTAKGKSIFFVDK